MRHPGALGATACGTAVDREGPLEYVELAGRRFERPLACFKLPGTYDSGGDGTTVGAIGRGLLRRFHVVSTNAHGRIALLAPSD